MTEANKTLLIVCGVAAVTLCLSTSAWACPWCDGGATGLNPVRDGIFNKTFLMRAAAVLAPFPVFTGIVALIYFGPPKIRLFKND
jgi:hypothetical protein